MLDIHKTLFKAGLLGHDTVMIHADAGVAAQFFGISKGDRLNYLIGEIINYFSDGGTVVVPTFSYSFTKRDQFDVENTPGDVGLFSEAFRQVKGVLRSAHPIFSVAALGNYAKDFSNSRTDDCFGINTAFDVLVKKDAKIICLGCDFSRITFIHYVEQFNQVDYRYMKEFDGFVVAGNRRQHLTTSYYVRDTSINTECDLDMLRDVGVNQRLIYSGEFGRFPFYSTRAIDLYNLASELLVKNKYALIKQRFSIEI